MAEAATSSSGATVAINEPDLAEHAVERAAPQGSAPSVHPSPPSAPTALTRIEPSGRWRGFGLSELWAYRELLVFLTWRDVAVRYKQTVLGVAWAVLQPTLTMVVFSLFFGRLAKVPSDDLPYPIFAYTALLPWTFFATGITQSSQALVSSANLISKVYFPRLAVPISAVLGGGVDFALAFVILLVMMAGYGIAPTAAVVVLPALVLLTLVASLGVGMWLSALNVRYRDVRYIVPFLVQLWLFATPVAYSSRLLDQPWRTLYGINPMVGVVDGFRWALLGTDRPPMGPLALSVIAALALLVSGTAYFRRTERVFADVV
jgi:lipopolysaccharide transport system permease protein